MRVKVCDALCGCGKTSSCINMMNEYTDRKYIFVTQYLTEVKRIMDSCKTRNFVTPISDEKTNKTKLSDVHELISQGKNIATTHSLFLSYTAETKKLIQDQHYTLVLDEVVDVLCPAEISRCDMELLRKSETIQEDGELITWLDDEYDNDERGKFREEMLRAKSKNFLKFNDYYFFWGIAPELFTSFDEVYVLTYMFRAQPLRCFFELYNIDYELIGTKNSGNTYEFCDISEMDRARDLREKIHVLNNPRINEIGSGRTSLSYSWYQHSRREDDFPKLTRMKNNLSNLFKNVWKAPADEVMWTTFKEYEQYINGKGYKNAFITYNKRASNEYSNRRYLAYCVNNFPRPFEARFFTEHGVTVDSDMYALSILIQWMFRSAIRNGEEIWLYVPSARMRELLMKWLDKLAAGEDLSSIIYKSPRRVRAKGSAKRSKPGRPSGKSNKSKKGNKSCTV